MMGKNANQQPEILENIKKEIAAAEKKLRDLRFTYNLNDFLRGNIQVLTNDEFISELGAGLTADQFLRSEEKTMLLKQLGKGVLDEKRPVREKSLVLLSSIAKVEGKLQDQAALHLLYQALCRWLEFETELVAGFVLFLKTIENLLRWYIKNACWNEAEEIILLLHRIQSGELKKSKAIESLTGGTLRNLQEKAIIELLTNEYLQEAERKHHFRNMLHALGGKAAVYLLDRINHGQNRLERLSLLELMPTFGDIALPALQECLAGNPPWPIVRNVICIIAALGNVGNDDHFALVRRYFAHPDERVQNEMINCAKKLGGPMMKNRLLEGLHTVHERLKAVIILLLVEQTDNDQEVVAAILDLARKGNVLLAESNTELLFALIAALQIFSSRESIGQLQTMRDELQKQKNSEQLLLRIDEALKIIEPKVRHQAQDPGSFTDIASLENDPEQQRLVLEEIRETEEEIRKLVHANDIQQAGELLYDQAITAAKNKNFPIVELLRERLLEINPMALEKVIELGELIQEQKNTSFTSHHLKIWSELYGEMSPEEYSDLYCSLRQENFFKGDIIVHSGETDANLYFINSGYISMGCRIGGKEIFLKKMVPGSVLGGDQFFLPSVWTVTLKALTEVNLHVLDHAVMEKVSRKHPEIEDKLRKYCFEHAQTPELLKMSRDDRREFPRYHVNFNARHVLLDPLGNEAKRNFNSEVFNISEQGLAFIMKITNIVNARLLLGRYITTTILCGEEELPQQFGVIVSVILHEPVMGEYSVHVKLAKKIDPILFRKILMFCKAG